MSNPWMRKTLTGGCRAVLMVWLGLPLTAAWPDQDVFSGFFDQFYPDEEEGFQAAEYEYRFEQPYVLTGALLRPDGVKDGGLLVRSGLIEEVWKGAVPGSVAASHYPTIKTEGLIMPGLIDIHNHVGFNFLPLWNPPRAFSNRYQWANNSSFSKTHKKPYSTMKKKDKLLDEMTKYGEIRSLIGGTTSILGADRLAANAGILVRNIDFRTLSEIRNYVYVLEVNRFGCRPPGNCAKQTRQIAEMTGDFAAGRFRAFVLHIAEGTDQRSRNEFNWLEDHNLLQPQVVITHGVALRAPEFHKMHQAGMGLVWSPRSNLILYHQTADVGAAKSNEVKMALGPDWSPSGSDNLLAELRFASDYNHTNLNDLFTAKQLVEMATSNPADLIGWGDKLGRLEKGYVADLLVLDKKPGDPYQSILKSNEENVNLVAVNGEPIYGLPEWLETLGKSKDKKDYELIKVRGVTRGLDATVPAGDAYPKGSETFGQISNLLQQAYQPWGQLPGLTANGP